MTDKIDIPLTQDECAFIIHGTAEWFGPGRPTDALVQAMGFNDLDHFRSEIDRLGKPLQAEQPLDARDWARVLVSTEIVFASDYFGSGGDWEAATGIDDERSIQLLRAVQNKLIGIAKGVQL